MTVKTRRPRKTPTTSNGTAGPVPIGPRLVVNPKFRALIPPHSAAELAQLEKSIKTLGVCIKPLVVWKGHNILLDGHNRYKFCLMWNVPFQIVEMEFPDEAAAKQWIVDNQLDQRNLRGLGRLYTLGLRYQADKGKRGGNGANQHTPKEMAHAEPIPPTATANLLHQYRVSRATAKRGMHLVELLVKIEASAGADSRRLLLSPDHTCSEGDVKWLAGQELAVQQEALRILEETGILERVGEAEKAPVFMRVPREPAGLVAAVAKLFTLEQLKATRQGFDEVIKAMEAEVAAGEA